MSVLFLFGLLAIIVLLIGLGQPVFVLLGAVAAYLLMASGEYTEFLKLTQIVEQTRDLADQDILLAIPFFIVAGAVMTEGDIAKRLIEFAKAVFGWLPGGLAISATFACVFFAAISGSSPVTVIAIGSIMFPAMIKEGYRERFSSGLVTSAGSLGILIPPSIPMIVYAIAVQSFEEPERVKIAAGVELGVTDLFLAGVGPGLIIAVIFSTYAIIEGLRGRIPRTPFSLARFWKTAYHGFWALMLPVIILGGIYSGAFTATSAACVAVVYSIVVERFIHRSVRFGNIRNVFVDSAVLIGALLLILAVAQGFNHFMERAKIAELAVDKLVEWNLGPVAFLLAVNILLLITGCFMDILSAILIMVPLLAPIAHQLGIHPLHLGVVFIVNLEIGYLTPPLGINLFVATSLFRKSLGEIIRGVIPFTGLMLVGLLFVTYVPSLSLGLVSVYHGGSFAVPFPAPHVPMDELDLRSELKLLAGLAEEEASAPARAGPTGQGRVLNMEDLMSATLQDRESQRIRTLRYESLAEMLRDFRAVRSGQTRVRDLTQQRNNE